MFSENSIYQCIVENVNEQGELPEGFHLPHPAPEEDDPFPIMFADGAQDGMAMYHIMPHDASEETLEDFREAFKIEADEDLAQKMCILLNDGIEAVDDGSGEFKLELVEDNYDFVEE